MPLRRRVSFLLHPFRVRRCVSPARSSCRAALDPWCGSEILGQLEGHGHQQKCLTLLVYGWRSCKIYKKPWCLHGVYRFYSRQTCVIYQRTYCRTVHLLQKLHIFQQSKSMSRQNSSFTIENIYSNCQKMLRYHFRCWKTNQIWNTSNLTCLKKNIIVYDI